MSSTAAISIDTNGQNVNFATSMGSSNTAGLVKIGNGTLTLGVSNCYAGGTTLSGGTLVAANDSASSSGPVTLSPSSGAVTLDFTSAAPSIGSLGSSGAGSSSIVLGNATADTPTTLTAGANNASTTFGGSISDLSITASGAVGSLTKAGSGTLTLAGSNTYTGLTTVGGGVLQLGARGDPLRGQYGRRQHIQSRHSGRQWPKHLDQCPQWRRDRQQHGHWRRDPDRRQQ